MWPLYGGEFAVTQSEVKAMLNDINNNGLACFDLSMKNYKQQGKWLKERRKVTIKNDKQQGNIISEPRQPRTIPS